MGSYLESSDAALIALTRLRRAERQATLVEQRHCLRAAATLPSAEFKARCAPATSSGNRRRSSMQAWRKRQWKVGVRSCFYCRCAMTKVPKFGRPPPSSVTVDHRVALANDGIDDAINWVMCCSQCNNRKGSMSEAEFILLLSAQVGQRAEASDELQQEDDGDQRHDHHGDHADGLGQRELRQHPPHERAHDAEDDKVDEEREHGGRVLWFGL